MHGGDVTHRGLGGVIVRTHRGHGGVIVCMDPTGVVVQWTLTYPNPSGPTPVHICQKFGYAKS